MMHLLLPVNTSVSAAVTPELKHKFLRGSWYMVYQDIIFEIKGNVAWITFNKPAVKNAMGKQTLIELAAAMEEISQKPFIAAAVIRGAGGTFCSGMDLRDLTGGPTGPGAAEFTSLADKAFIGVETCRKVLIAVIEGYCLAGGFEIALGCDFIIADENAKIADGHIKTPGFVPNGGASIRLAKLIGMQKAKEMLFTGDMISGKEAERIGLAGWAVPSNQLNSTLESLLNRLTDKSPIGLEHMKELVKTSYRHDMLSGLPVEHAAVQKMGNTQDHLEALAAAKEKRKPSFQGK
jgi:enoyl-CoA hydratase